MRNQVFFALGCVLYVTGCDSSSLEKVIPHSDGKRDSVFSHPQHTE